MVKFEKNLGIVVVVAVGVLAVLVCGNESPSQASVSEAKKIGVQQPKDVKIYVEDHSRVLTKEEVDKLVNKDSLPVAKPVDESDKNKVKPKLVGDNAAIEGVNKIDDGGVKLPPIPIIMPNLPFNLFDSNSDAKASDDQSTSDDDSSKPKGLIRLFIMHSSNNNNNKPSDDDEEKSDASLSDGGVKSSSFVIFKIFSNSWGSLFGGPNDPDNEASAGAANQKLLGGDDDVDKKRVHLLGGGGENDPDRIRFKLDDENQVFTGGDDLTINSMPMEHHKMMMMSMYDRIRNLFGMDMDQQSSSDSDAVDSMSAPFIIRTDDGSSAIIPNDIGYAEKQQSMNKCMMLSFMRLKASMYYRTILHLLFFTGVMLFILSLIMLTVRSLRRRRALRRPLSISTIETNGGGNTYKDASANKFNSYRAWSGDMEQSLIGCDSKIVLIQAPPAYDQVIINDKTSALTHGPSSQLLTSNNKSTTTDDCETKSLPPEYDASVNNH